MASALSGAASTGCVTTVAVDNLKQIQLATSSGKRTFCGDDPEPLKLTVTFKNGRRLDTKNETLDGTQYVFSTDAGKVAYEAIADGITNLRYIPSDPFNLLERDAIVTVYAKDRPKLKTTLALAPDLGCTVKLGGSGEAGASGSGQSSGADANGRQAASAGSDGFDGRPGAAGPSLRVSVASVESKKRGTLTAVSVDGDGRKPQHALVSGKGKVVVRASGGAGGAGGDGGRGGSGSKVCGGEAGANGGAGGSGGPGGPGGVVVIEVAEGDEALQRAIDVRNEGGRGGAQGVGGPGGSAGLCGGRAGAEGASGSPGARGPDGSSGPAPTTRTMSRAALEKRMKLR